MYSKILISINETGHVKHHVCIRQLYWHIPHSPAWNIILDIWDFLLLGYIQYICPSHCWKCIINLILSLWSISFSKIGQSQSWFRAKIWFNQGKYVQDVDMLQNILLSISLVKRRNKSPHPPWSRCQTELRY